MTSTRLRLSVWALILSSGTAVAYALSGRWLPAPITLLASAVFDHDSVTSSRIAKAAVTVLFLLKATTGGSCSRGRLRYGYALGDRMGVG